jgi:hypothetical protein
MERWVMPGWELQQGGKAGDPMPILKSPEGEMVAVLNVACFGRDCYWPRTDPGVFIPGRGYKRRGRVADERIICGTREIHGCPDNIGENDK